MIIRLVILECVQTLAKGELLFLATSILLDKDRVKWLQTHCSSAIQDYRRDSLNPYVQLLLLKLP